MKMLTYAHDTYASEGHFENTNDCQSLGKQQDISSQMPRY